MRTLDGWSRTADVYVTATGNRDVITAGHLARMEHQAIVGNIGTSTTRSSRRPGGRAGDRAHQHQAPGGQVGVPDGHAVIVLSEGRLLNLGDATGHPAP